MAYSGNVGIGTTSPNATSCSWPYQLCKDASSRIGQNDRMQSVAQSLVLQYTKRTITGRLGSLSFWTGYDLPKHRWWKHYSTILLVSCSPDTGGSVTRPRGWHDPTAVRCFRRNLQLLQRKRVSQLERCKSSRGASFPPRLLRGILQADGYVGRFRIVEAKNCDMYIIEAGR